MNDFRKDYFDHFAYGSNMSTLRLRQRCPSAVVIAAGYVIGRRLRFHKIGQDGTSKADAHWTGDEGDLLYGVVYRCHLRDRATLDRCESLGVGYNATAVDVHLIDGSERHRVFLYEALPTMIDSSMRPAAWYVDHVLRGAAEHGLPLDYQARLRQWAAGFQVDQTDGLGIRIAGG
ncbi:gamma-glutamylcyclotransferase family protein [Aporhodopirellula aestuarii]|uniref:Gamma-glutamylcyclotransferase n=1 Tax=Aporhodopirellula aestuarii TaxID=2950107 RepID=A0ABT0U0T6_9BACT|nr:gamma-glutamylcyclotransferase family protein [Aporhodopirellula aestuarii]MCM2370457.1 gamma-glutamylcyclotransferase [Aporhodopirellula aestuarii]